MLLFHRAMPIVYKSSTYLNFCNLLIRHSIYTKIQALWLLQKQQTGYFLDMCHLGKVKLNAWAYISKEIISDFNFDMLISANMLYQYSVYSEEFG